MPKNNQNTSNNQKDNPEILVAKQAVKAILNSQESNPELDFQQNNNQNQSPSVIYGREGSGQEIDYGVSEYPDVVFTKNEKISDPELDFQQNQSSDFNPEVVFGSEFNNIDKQNEAKKTLEKHLTIPDLVFTNNDDKDVESKNSAQQKKMEEELNKRKENFLEDMKKEGLKENQLKNLAKIPVKEKNDYFFFVLVTATALGGPVGFAVASLACEKLGFQLGGVIRDSRNFNPDPIVNKIMKPVLEFTNFINTPIDGYDRSFAPALYCVLEDKFKEYATPALSYIKEKFIPRNNAKPNSAECLGEAKNLEHVGKVKNQEAGQSQENQRK